MGTPKKTTVKASKKTAKKENNLPMVTEGNVAEVVAEVVTPVEKSVKIVLTQTNKNGKQNASFMFSATGSDFTDFIKDTCTKVLKVMELQNTIKAKGGKNNIFGLSKSGNFELNIVTIQADNKEFLLNNFEFTLDKLGTENQSEVLIAMVEGYKILTD